MSWIFKTLSAILPNDTIRVKGSPYLTRFYLTGRPKKDAGERPGVRVHFFHSSDQGPDLHNHPWSGTSLILSGGYRERRRASIGSVLIPTGTDIDDTYIRVPLYSHECEYVRKPGSVNRLGLNDYHAIELLSPASGCWTLFFTGRRVKEWGFLSEDNIATQWDHYRGDVS